MLKPPGNKIAIIPFFDPDTSPGGLIVPDSAKERSDQGIVKYVGPECKLVMEGDYVFFPGYTGETFRIPDEGVLIFMDETKISGILDEELYSKLEIPGLFFKGKDGVHFPANYAFAMDLIYKALNETPWRKHWNQRKRARMHYRDGER